MEIKLLKNEGFTYSGSGLLRSFQNEKMPSLDLLVREAIQNSMDAKREDKNFVREEININDFNLEIINEFFPQIQQQLYIKYRIGAKKYISISDKNTVGLTGPIRISDIIDTKWGRFLSLVQGIAKPQENQGAGGSWGLGKTVYYRIGIGLVIFYSRINEDGIYKNRLMACLVENEKDKNSILMYSKKYNSKTGVAWWGKKDEENDENVVPIEDEEEIKRILSAFDLRIYEGDETGTTIIIPFVNERQLLNTTFTSSIDDDNIPWWCKTLEDYLTVAVQKWYPTKLMNIEGSSNYYTNGKISNKIESSPWLDLYINGKQFNKEEMLPLFSIIQELYNYAKKEEYESDLDIHVEPIIIKSTFRGNKPTGKLLYVTLNKDELGMSPPDNEESPLTQINNDRIEEESNNLIITFCRKPGMILKYSINDEWTNGIVNQNKNTYMIALFIPNGYNEIDVYDDGKRIINLEEYLRASEEADHNNWTDIGEFNYKDIEKLDVSKLKIISKIQKNIKNKLKNELKVEEEKVTIGVGTLLSRQLTKWFLPQIGFGKKSIKSTIKVENESKQKINPKKRIKKSKMELAGLEVSNKNELYKPFSIEICEGDFYLDYSFSISSDNDNLDANKWEEMHLKFPVEITKIQIDNFIYKDGTIENVEEGIEKISNIKFEKTNTKMQNIWYGFKLKILNEDITNINGRIYYKYIDSSVEINMIREKGASDEQ